MDFVYVLNTFHSVNEILCAADLALLAGMSLKLVTVTKTSHAICYSVYLWRGEG